MKILFCLVIFSSSLASAQRVVKMVPIDTPSGWSENNGACMIGFSRVFSLVNLGSETQTITIRTKNVKTNHVTCGIANAPAGSDWINVGGTCFGLPKDYPYSEDSVVLQPNGSTTISMSFGCDLRKDGVSNCVKNIQSTMLPGDGGRQSYNGLAQGEATHEIEIAENRGAVVGSVIAAAISSCDELRNNTKNNIPINGGKAF